jgi:hypothetical protein
MQKKWLFIFLVVLAKGASASSITQPVSIAAIQTSAAATPISVSVSTTVVNSDGSFAVCVSTWANVAASQTDQILVQAVAGKSIRIMGAKVICGSTATAITFNSKGSGAGTAIGPTDSNAANGGYILPPFNLGWSQTNSGEALSVTTGAGSTTSVRLAYCLF